MLRWISLHRFALVLSLLPKARVQKILEVGYGSGVFMPELHRRCEKLYGIDIHDRDEAVGQVLSGFGVDVVLARGSAEAMPFPDDHFDFIVCMSALEFIGDLEAAAREFQRTLRRGGGLFVVTPGYSGIADLGLQLLTGKRAVDEFGSGRQHVVPTLQRYFRAEQELNWPLRPVLYRALHFRPDKN